MPLLSPAAVEEKLKELQGWSLAGKEIVREFSFSDFVEALRFVNAVGERAEAAGHHPDIDIRYTKVTCTLTTHDVGGVTQKDLDMANEIDFAAER